MITPQDTPVDTETITTVADLVGTLHPWERHLLVETVFLQPETAIW